jgi:putative transposase
MARFFGAVFELCVQRQSDKLSSVPRANRYILPGYIYHLTHRCHDRQFLLRFARDRNAYRRRLREAVWSENVALLTYNITSNHVHLIVYAEQAEQIARLVQRAAGEFAREYNRRKQRSGAFWEGRYHATLVGSGEYLWECLRYVELNMVRCGVARHPREWAWSGYGELMGWRRRNRLLDVRKLLWLVRCNELSAFRAQLNERLEDAIINDQLQFQAKWTQSIAVGDRAFIEQIEQKVRGRQQTQTEEEDGSWVLREEHGSLFVPEKSPIDSVRPSISL